MNVSLTAELERFIHVKVEAGGYRTASEVVREALRLLQERDHLYHARLNELRGAIEIGARELAEGHGEVFDRAAATKLKKEVRDSASASGAAASAGTAKRPKKRA